MKELTKALILAKPGRLLPIDNFGRMAPRGVKKCINAIIVLAGFIEKDKKIPYQLNDLGASERLELWEEYSISFKEAHETKKRHG